MISRCAWSMKPSSSHTLRAACASPRTEGVDAIAQHPHRGLHDLAELGCHLDALAGLPVEPDDSLGDVGRLVADAGGGR